MWHTWRILCDILKYGTALLDTAYLKENIVIIFGAWTQWRRLLCTFWKISKAQDLLTHMKREHPKLHARLHWITLCLCQASLQARWTDTAKDMGSTVSHPEFPCTAALSDVDICHSQPGFCYRTWSPHPLCNNRPGPFIPSDPVRAQRLLTTKAISFNTPR